MKGQSSSFLFLGNDECLNFLNTEISERGKTIDLLPGFEDLVGWLAEMDYIDPGISARMLDIEEPERQQMLLRVREFRSHLKRVIKSVSSGKPLILSHLDPINEALAKETSYKKLLLINSEPYMISHSAADKFDPLAPLAAGAASLLTEKDIGLVRQCEGEGCVLYFYDESKNHARRWCSMKRCGNRMKAALHYKKMKEMNRL